MNTRDICTSRDTCQFSECPHRRILAGKRPYTKKTCICRLIWKIIEFILMLIILILLIISANNVEDECGALKGGLAYLAAIITAFFIITFLLLLSYIICSPVTRAVDATLCILGFVFLIIAAIILFIPHMAGMLPDEEECRKKGQRLLTDEHDVSEYSYLYDDQGLFDRVEKKIKPADMNDFEEAERKYEKQNTVDKNDTRRNNGSSTNDTIVTLKDMESRLVMNVANESSVFHQTVKLFVNRQKKNNISKDDQNYRKRITDEERDFPSHLKRKIEILPDKLQKQHDSEKTEQSIQQLDHKTVIKLQKQNKFLHKGEFYRKHRGADRPNRPPWTPNLNDEYFFPVIRQPRPRGGNNTNGDDSSGFDNSLVMVLGFLCLVVAIVFLLDVFRMGFCDMYY